MPNQVNGQRNLYPFGWCVYRFPKLTAGIRRSENRTQSILRNVCVCIQRHGIHYCKHKHWMPSPNTSSSKGYQITILTKTGHSQIFAYNLEPIVIQHNFCEAWADWYAQKKHDFHMKRSNEWVKLGTSMNHKFKLNYAAFVAGAWAHVDRPIEFPPSANSAQIPKSHFSAVAANVMS